MPGNNEESSELSKAKQSLREEGFSFDNLANQNEERKIDHEKKIKRAEMESVISERKYGLQSVASFERKAKEEEPSPIEKQE